MTTVTGPTDLDPYPYCGTSDGIRQISDADHTQAWSCDRCHTDWAFSVIRPDWRAAVLLTDLGAAAAQEIRRLRWTLRQVVTLADDVGHALG